MTNRTKYINGMNEIKVDNSLKQSIINKSGMNTSILDTARTYRVAMIAVSCMIIFLLAIGGRFVLHNGDQASLSGLFSGFVVTAYAADGSPLVVKPDIDFPLGQYSMIMSSVPGFPITIACKDTEIIIVRSSEGQLLLWNPADSKVKHLGKQVTVRSGDTIYWSPLVEGNHSPTVATQSVLQITAYKDHTKLGNSTIEIKSDEHHKYKGKLTN